MIQAGDAYAEMEVMKMCLPVVSAYGGRIHFAVPEKSGVEVFLPLSVECFFHLLMSGWPTPG